MKNMNLQGKKELNPVLDDVLKKKIQDICDECNNIHSNFNKRNKETILTYRNDKLKMNIKYEKDFKEHLQKKLNKLDNRLNILQMKYNTYKKWYDRLNIMIIIMSSSLSIFSALKIELDDIIQREGSTVGIYFNMIPIGMSSAITCTAAITKFKKYQEKMENMQFTREKVIMAISKIKSVQESLWFNNESEFEGIKQKYMEDTYNVYNESNSELERHIKFNDHHKFLKIYNPPPVQKDTKPNNLITRP
jgi:hypothetical protein